MKPTTIESILARLRPDENGCSVWTAGKSSGYGTVGYQGKQRKVHVILYEHFVGPVPEGNDLDHLCRNRACANVQHLEPVTRRINILRGVSPIAEHAKKTHCPAGHPYVADNLYVTSRGTRQCRACILARRNALKEKRRQPPCQERTHCPSGHPYQGANLYIDAEGHRHCRACRQERGKQRRLDK